MWRIGVLLIATALFESVAAGAKPTDGLLIQRIKRSPHSCDNDEYYPQRHPRYWHPPPPRSQPFWPPPPQSSYWPPPPHHHRHNHLEEYFDDASKEEQPCSTCPKGAGVSSAVSNSKSENGDAIAVAIARASPKS